MNTFHVAYVYVENIFVGILQETDEGYSFAYDTAFRAPAEKMIAKIVSMQDVFTTMCQASFLPEHLKESFIALINDRVQVLADS